MDWKWSRTTAERATRLHGIETPGVLSAKTSVYIAREGDWILVVYQVVMRDYFGDKHAFIWHVKRDVAAVIGSLNPRMMGRTLEQIGASDDLWNAKISAGAAATDMNGGRPIK